jgi:putative membrane protein
MISTLYVPQGMADYSMVIASIAIAGAAACLLVSPLSRATAALAGRLGYRRASIGALVIVVLVVGTFTGAAGLFIMSIAAGIGLIPLLFGSRRMNCLGVILLPVACNMSGIGPAVAGALGLL